VLYLSLTLRSTRVCHRKGGREEGGERERERESEREKERK
jgi:hypothetical protein